MLPTDFIEHSGVIGQPLTEFPPLPDFTDRSGVPLLPNNAGQSGFPPLPNFNEQPGFPPLPNNNEQSGFPPLPNFNEQPGFPPLPNNNEQSGFPPLPNFNEPLSFPPLPNFNESSPGFNVSGEELISLAFPADFPSGQVEFPPLPFDVGRALPDINVNKADFPPLPDFNSARGGLNFPAIPDFGTEQSQSADSNRPRQGFSNFPPLPDFTVSSDFRLSQVLGLKSSCRPTWMLVL
jgi:hypothetical protein